MHPIFNVYLNTLAVEGNWDKKKTSEDEKVKCIEQGVEDALVEK